MNVLDLDLDYFISDIAHFICDSHERLPESEYKAWSSQEFRSFLEDKCNLSKESKIKGCVVKKHHGVYKAWRDLIERQQLDYPFNVVHIDAHSDFGLGDSSWTEIIFELLHKNVEERKYPSKLGEGNYLSYAIANRWIKKLDFVAHPEWELDLMQIHMKNHDDYSGYIQLKKYKPIELGLGIDMSRIQPESLEPEVEFNILKQEEFINDVQYDYVFLSQSPTYTPASADLLIDVFKEYIDELEFEQDILKYTE